MSLEDEDLEALFATQRTFDGAEAYKRSLEMEGQKLEAEARAKAAELALRQHLSKNPLGGDGPTRPR